MDVTVFDTPVGRPMVIVEVPSKMGWRPKRKPATKKTVVKVEKKLEPTCPR